MTTWRVIHDKALQRWWSRPQSYDTAQALLRWFDEWRTAGPPADAVQIEGDEDLFDAQLRTGQTVVRVRFRAIVYERLVIVEGIF